MPFRYDLVTAAIFVMVLYVIIAVTQFVEAGVCYENGAGVEKDSTTAARLFKLSADQGNAGAQYHLGKHRSVTCVTCISPFRM